jgi:hypothetical protein
MKACGVLAAPALAHVNDARFGRCVGHDGFAHQVVHQQHRGGLDGLERLEGEQLRVARAGADQGDLAWGVVEGVVERSCFIVIRLRCKMWATCCAMGAGTGRRPSSTLRVGAVVAASIAWAGLAGWQRAGLLLLQVKVWPFTKAS